MQARTRELELVNSVAGVVSGLVSLGDILRVSLAKTMDAFGIEAGGAYALEEETGTLIMRAHQGLSEEFVRQMSRIPLEDATAGKQLSLEQPLIFSADEYPEGDFKRFFMAEGLRRMIGVPLAAKRKLVGGFVLNSRHDRTLSPEEESLLIAVGRQVGLAIENARLLEREKIGRADADRRREVAEGLREMLSVLNTNRPLQETLNFIVSQACRLIGSDAASLLQAEAPGGVLRIRASCGLDPDYVSKVQFSSGKGGAGRALTRQEPVIVPDAAALVDLQERETDPEYAEEARGLRLMVGRGFNALLSVPLIVQGEGYGGITLYYRRPRQFSDEEVQVAAGLASQAALAIQNARLRTQAGEAAVFAERNRLARELHDSVTQSLYSVTLYAEAAARLLHGNQTAEAAEHLRELGGTAREALREMRLLIFELSPPALEKGSLVDALQIRLDAVESRGGMSVSFNVEGTERLDPRVRQELYQIAQEALNNTLKHSRARTVRILLRFGEDTARLEISDDGVGFEFDQAQGRGGIGLRSMRERVERCGGSLAVDTSPGGGTCVTVVAPMVRQDSPTGA
jgi:signal transduction histidine kinase